MMTKRSISMLPLVWLTVSGPLALVAQNNDDDTTGDVFDLGTFVVDGSEQRGYVATTSMSGTRLNQLVKDIPIPIDIITEDFIRDTGALTVAEALQYTAGLETEITSKQVGENPPPTSTSFRLRGFVSQAVLRNGFRREGTSDTINVSQVDVVRGPNALLYGIGNFGGVVNYVTKLPQDKFNATASVVLGSWDFYRFQVDVTGPIREGLSYRVPVMYQTNKNWFDHYDQTKIGVAPVLLYKITEKTRVQLEFDYYKTENTTPENPLSKGFRGVDTLGFIDPTFHPVNQGFLVRPDREHRYVGPDTNRTQEDIGVLASVTHMFSDKLVMVLGYYGTETRLDSLRAGVKLDGGDFGVKLTPIASILSPDLIGPINRARYPWAFNPLHERYADWSAEQFNALEYSWSKEEKVRERDQARLEFTYRPDWFGLKHTIMFGVTIDRLAQRVTPWGFKDLDQPQNNPKTDKDNTGLNDARSRYHSIYNLEPIRFEPLPSEKFVQKADPIREYIGDALGSYLIHQTAMFNDRLRTITGLRFDRYQVGKEERYELKDSIDLVNDDSLTGKRKPSKTWQKATKEVNYSFGLSYAPTLDISLFALTASALDPETTGGQRTPDGLVPPPQSGQSYEVGAKIDFLEGKISGSLSAYTVTRENVVVDATISDKLKAPVSVIESPQWKAEGRDKPGDKVLRKDRSSGFDAQVFLVNLIPNFETILTFSYNKYEILDAVYLVYAGVNDAGQFVFDRINARANVGKIDGLVELPWDDTRLNNDTPKYSFRVWNKYTFRDLDNLLDGLDIGLGIRWTDRREASFGYDDNPSYKIIPDRLTVDLAIGYTIKVRERDLSLRLNITNLLDDDTVYGYQYTEPRRWRLTANYSF